MIIDNPIVSGSLNVQNDVTASNLAIASTASAAYFTGSFVGDGTQLSGVTSYTDGDTLDYINSLGVLSGSAQIASDISGSFTSLSSSLEQRITNQESFSQSLDATFATDQELSNVSGALALSISNISTDFADITNKPTLISSSAQFTDLTAPFTGSFTGSFYGDGSNLSGVTSYTDADTLAFINSRAVLSGSIAELTAVTASFLNTGSVTIPHSFNSKNVSVSVYDSNDILIIPQEIALISNNAVKLTFGGSTSGFAVVSKGGHIVSGSVPVPQLSTVTSAFTSTTSHTVTHNFNTKEVIVSVYENDSLIIPDTVTTDDVNNVTVTFPEAISGRVVVVKAGHIVSGSIPFDNLLDSPFIQSATAVTASKHIVPSQDLAYDLGSSTLRFRDLYLSSASIYLGNTVISEDNVVTTSSLQSVLPAGTLSGSAQIASDISGSFTLVSASIASERLKNTTDTLDGDLTVTGKITAQEFHTEFVSASIIYQSGSTQFGDTVDDTHLFQGKVGIGTTAIGATSGSLRIVGQTHSSAIDIENTSTGGERYRLVSLNGGGFAIENLTDSNNTLFKINTNGNIGIGTDNPTSALHVQGEISIGGGESADDAKMYFKASDNSARYTIETDLDGITGNDRLGFRSSDVDNILVFRGSGNVGIGNNTPIRKLHIDGGSISSDTPTIRISSTDSSGTNKFGIEFYSNNGADVRGKLLADNNGRVYIDDNGGGGVVLQANGGSGNVGIGTPTPSANLHVLGASTGIGRFEGANGDGGLDLKSTTQGTWELRARNFDDRLDIYSSTLFSTVATFHSSGKVGIGTTSPSISPAVNAGLHVENNNYIQLRLSSTVNSAGMEFIPYNSGNQHNYEVQATANGDWFIYDRTASAYRFNIEPSGDVAIGNSSSNFTSSGRRVLEINGTSEALLSFAHNGSWQYYIQTTSSGVFHSTGGKHFVVDPGSSNVGIGTSTTRSKLHVNGTLQVGAVDALNDAMVFSWAGSSSYGKIQTFSSSDLSLNPDGNNVGIGTTDPSEKFHMLGGKVRIHHQANGFAWIYGEDINHSLIIRGNRSSTVGNWTHYHQYGGDYSTGGGHHFWTGGLLANQSLRFSIANDYTVFQNTKVGINTTSPNGMLQVNGPIGIGERGGSLPVNMKHSLGGGGGVTFRIHVNGTTAWRPGVARIEVASATNGLEVQRAAWWFVRLTHYRDGGVSSAVLDSGGNTGNYTLNITASTSGNPQTIDIQITDSGADTLVATLDASFFQGIYDITDVS